MSESDNNDPKSKIIKEYNFGGIEEFDLEKIQSEILNDSVYLDVFAGSDPALKQDVQKMSAEKAASILKLNVYNFQYDNQKFKDKKLPEGERMGLMADEVEKLFPECIAKDAEGYRYVNYTMMIAPLLETVKQLEQKVSQLEKQLSEKK
ncbi:MAG: tail fiber domain-containing protein [Bdellovibrionota bacterium]